MPERTQAAAVDTDNGPPEKAEETTAAESSPEGSLASHSSGAFDANIQRVHMETPKSIELVERNESTVIDLDDSIADSDDESGELDGIAVDSFGVRRYNQKVLEWSTTSEVLESLALQEEEGAEGEKPQSVEQVVPDKEKVRKAAKQVETGSPHGPPKSVRKPRNKTPSGRIASLQARLNLQPEHFNPKVAATVKEGKVSELQKEIQSKMNRSQSNVGSSTPQRSLKIKRAASDLEARLPFLQNKLKGSLASPKPVGSLQTPKSSLSMKFQETASNLEGKLAFLQPKDSDKVRKSILTPTRSPSRGIQDAAATLGAKLNFRPPKSLTNAEHPEASSEKSQVDASMETDESGDDLLDTVSDDEGMETKISVEVTLDEDRLKGNESGKASSSVDEKTSKATKIEVVEDQPSLFRAAGLSAATETAFFNAIDDALYDIQQTLSACEEESLAAQSGEGDFEAPRGLPTVDTLAGQSIGMSTVEHFPSGEGEMSNTACLVVSSGGVSTVDTLATDIEDSEYAPFDEEKQIEHGTSVVDLSKPEDEEYQIELGGTTDSNVKETVHGASSKSVETGRDSVKIDTVQDEQTNKEVIVAPVAASLVLNEITDDTSVEVSVLHRESSQQQQSDNESGATDGEFLQLSFGDGEQSQIQVVTKPSPDDMSVISERSVEVGLVQTLQSREYTPRTKKKGRARRGFKALFSPKKKDGRPPLPKAKNSDQNTKNVGPAFVAADAPVAPPDAEKSHKAKTAIKAARSSGKTSEPFTDSSLKESSDKVVIEGSSEKVEAGVKQKSKLGPRSLSRLFSRKGKESKKGAIVPGITTQSASAEEEFSSPPRSRSVEPPKTSPTSVLNEAWSDISPKEEEISYIEVPKNMNSVPFDEAPRNIEHEEPLLAEGTHEVSAEKTPEREIATRVDEILQNVESEKPVFVEEKKDEAGDVEPGKDFAGLVMSLRYGNFPVLFLACKDLFSLFLALFSPILVKMPPTLPSRWLTKCAMLCKKVCNRDLRRWFVLVVPTGLTAGK